MPTTIFSRARQTRFSLVHQSLVETGKMQFESSVSDRRILEIFAEHDVHFGDDPEAVYTPLLTLWGLLSQVFFKDEQRSCLAAVVRIAAWWFVLGKRICDSSTGAYCRARKRIQHSVLRQISREIANQHSLSQPRSENELALEMGIGPGSQYSGGRLIMVDGFTVTCADTPENQAEYPQNSVQTEGLGFPILRGVALICMRTGLLIDAELGPYSGKESGETALFWKMREQLEAGDVVVADSYYCTYWLLAACLARGVHVVMRNHHLREDEPVAALRLGRGHVIATWALPQRPAWMDEATYQSMPTEIRVRLVKCQNEQAGQRTHSITIATTLLDHKLYCSRWLAGIYRGRWRVELDIRAIKVTLGMDILRAKSPEMVRTELWSCLLVYNLIRESMLKASTRTGRCLRSMSFTATLQMMGNLWLLSVLMNLGSRLAELRLELQTSTHVGNRPNRFEPREKKRRPKGKLMTKPRHIRRAELANELT